MDLPSIIWKVIEYSSYTVMQASRRSWRIGQDEDVKVYFFCYAETLQEEALSLIASKIAATTRVNGDIIDTNSLADLDEFASTDMVSALTNVVTRSGETRSLKDAFREANEAFRAGQEVIGDYRGREEAEESVDSALKDLPLFQFNFPPKACAFIGGSKGQKVKTPPAKPIILQLSLFNQPPRIPAVTIHRKIRPNRRNSMRHPQTKGIELSFV